jgi:hypothetical protein
VRLPLRFRVVEVVLVGLTWSFSVVVMIFKRLLTQRLCKLWKLGVNFPNHSTALTPLICTPENDGVEYRP